jgi:hypothetical protein
VKVAGTVAVAAAVVTLAPAAVAAGSVLASGAGMTGAAVAATTAVHDASAARATIVLGSAANAAAMSTGENAASVIGDALTGGAVGQVAPWAATGKEFKISKDLRVAPFGNRTNNPKGQLPHYHRRIPDPGDPTGQGSKHGQGFGNHRPWEGGW